jgi:hypothetical protein
MTIEQEIKAALESIEKAKDLIGKGTRRAALCGTGRRRRSERDKASKWPLAQKSRDA